MKETTSNFRVSIDVLENIIRPKVKKFISEILKGRYKEHVSDSFIEAYIVREFLDEYFANTRNIPVNIAYKSCVTLFESLLEHGCKTGGNGHHVAQSFCNYFSDYPSFESLIEVQN